MTTLTASERGDLAERMLPIACQLAVIVHGEGDQQDIAHVLSQLDDTERQALIVALAALINPDKRLADALDYVRWDEEGRPAPPTLVRRTIRQEARQQWTPTDASDPRQEALRLHLQGISAGRIAERVGVTERTVNRWKNTWAAAA